MLKDLESTLFTLFVVVVIVLLCSSIYMLPSWVVRFAEFTCEKAWQESGMDSRFQTFVGCQIQLPDGRWIPARNYREI